MLAWVLPEPVAADLNRRHGAAMAGVPEAVLSRAKTLLEKLERGQTAPTDDRASSSEQLDLFGGGEPPSGPMALDAERIEAMSEEEAKAALRVLAGVPRSTAAV